MWDVSDVVMNDPDMCLQKNTKKKKKPKQTAANLRLLELRGGDLKINTTKYLDDSAV